MGRMKFWARRKKKEQGKPIVENQHQLIVKTKTSDDGMNMVLRSSQRDDTEVSSDNVEESSEAHCRQLRQVLDRQ